LLETGKPGVDLLEPRAISSRFRGDRGAPGYDVLAIRVALGAVGGA
jgi:hypothetical protein